MQQHSEESADSGALTDPAESSADSAESPGRLAEPSSPSGEPSVVARARIHERARRIAERELDRTCSDLDLDPEQRAELARLTERLVARLLAGPDAALQNADDAALAVGALALLTD